MPPPEPPHPPNPPAPPPFAPVPPSPPPLKPGGLTGDPHLHLAHGGEADFRGEDGYLYAMLHHSGLAVNVLFEACAFFLSGQPPLVVEDLSIAVTQNDNTEVLHVRTAGWAIDATARLIQRSATSGKKQVDLSFAPLQDPLAPNPKTGKVVAPHGLVGQSFDGDDIAVDGKKDRCVWAPGARPRLPQRRARALRDLAFH